MIGLILFVLDVLLVCIISLIIYPLSLLIGLFDKKAKDIFSLRFVQFSLRTFMFAAGAKVRYIGLENLPRDGRAVVYTGNHRSFFDVIASYPVLPGLTGFIAKKEMIHWPVISWWMRGVYCLFLDRSNKRAGLKTILEGVQNVKSGVSMVIFPEGTRSHKEGHLGMFHYGSFKLATKAGAPVVPVAFSNSGAIWDDHLPWIRRETMVVEFCKPIETAGMSDSELAELPDRVREIVYERHIANAKAIGSLPEDFEREDE